MRPGRSAPAQHIEDVLDHAAAVSAALRARQQIDVQVRGIHLVRLRTEVVRVVIGVVDVLDRRPVGRVPLRRGKLRAQALTPVRLIACIESVRIQRAERVTANPLSVFENKAQLRLQGEVGADEYPSERIRIVTVERLAVLTVVSGLETDIVRTRFITGVRRTDAETRRRAAVHQGGTIPLQAMVPAEPAIRLLTTADLDDAFGLSAAAGWNQGLPDWRMLLQLAPAGSFAAVAERRVVGTAIGIHYGTFGWIAMMLVDPSLRGRGLGARLLEAAMGAVPPDIPIRLDATPLGRPLYQRYGFEDEVMLTRHVAEPSRSRLDGAADLVPPDVRPLTAVDLPAVAALDRQVFGADRRILLEWALDGAPQYAHAIETDAGMHYCLGRRGRLFDLLGPVVAADDDTAHALVSASLVAAVGRAVAVDSFDRYSGFTGWLRSRGFTAQRPLFRMQRAPRLGGEAATDGSRAVHERAILGPEFG